MVTPAYAALAVDVGNSKTDLVLIRRDGGLAAAVRGRTASHQAIGLEGAMEQLRELASRAAAGDRTRTRSSMPLAELGIFAMAGADFPSDVRLLRQAISELGIVSRVEVVNDTLAVLRAGSRRPWGVALVCGQGVNGVGVGVDGRVARFDGVGDISGDWGGGTGIGLAAHAAAVRGRDGRGPRTALEHVIPAAFGLRTPRAVVRALYEGRLEHDRLGALSPLVFETAMRGDAVARGIVNRLVDELGTMARALIRRSRLTRRDPDVVLAGGLFRTPDTEFHEGLAERILATAPRARIVRLHAPPVLGAALLAADRGAAIVDPVLLGGDLLAWAVNLDREVASHRLTGDAEGLTPADRIGHGA